jgi:cytoskeleton protein RodZ
LQNKVIPAKRVAKRDSFLISRLYQTTMATVKTKASGTARPKNNVEAAAPIPPLLGAQLREAREAANLTLEAVAEELMIRKYYLIAIEDGAYRNLPERVYAIGFVQNYCNLLGLDTPTLIEQFKREAYGGRGAAAARVELNMPTPASQSMLPSRSALFAVGGALLILVVGGLIWSARAPQQPATSIPQPPTISEEAAPASMVQSADVAPVANADDFINAAPVPDKTAIVSGEGTITTTDPDADIAANTAAHDAADKNAETAPVAADTATGVATTTTPTAAPPAGTRILVEALQSSWVEVADADGNILYTNILRVGQALPIPNKPGVTLTTGNASGIQLVIDGKKMGPLGRTGEVKRAITLDPDKLSKR